MNCGCARYCSAVQGHDIEDDRRAHVQLNGANGQEWIILAVQDVLVLKPKLDPHSGPGGQT